MVLLVIVTLFAWGLWQGGLIPLWVAVTSTVLTAIQFGAEIYKAAKDN